MTTQSEAIYQILEESKDWLSLDDIISRMGIARHIVRGRLSMLRKDNKVERKKTKKGIFYRIALVTA